MQADGRPHVGDVEALLITRALAPTHGRHQWELATGRLFSIEGLFDHIVHEGHYPVGEGRATAPFPWNGANATIFDVARWFARLGFRPAEVRFLEDFYRRRRNVHENRDVELSIPYTTFPSVRGDVSDDMIPQFAVLTPIPNYVIIPIPEADVSMGDDQSEENPQAASGSTIPDETRQE